MSYEARDFDYESGIWGEEIVRPSDRTFAGFRLTTLLAALPERGKVIEVGCGAGRFLRGVAAMRPRLSVVGVDVSRTALARAAEIAPGIDFRIRVEPSAPLPAADGEFDAAIALDVLEHVEDPAYMLGEIHRILAPGGRLHFHVPCEGDALSLWRWIPGQAGPRGLKRRFGGHVQRFRRRDVVSLLEASGFEIQTRSYSLHLVGNVADVVAFVGILAAVDLRKAGPALTTGTLTARSARREGDTRGFLNVLIRFVDGLIWAEAKLLSRLPSWSVHLTARKRGAVPSAPGLPRAPGE